MSRLGTLEYRTLEASRISLQIPDPKHVVGIFDSFASDPEVTKFLAWRHAMSFEDCKEAMVGRLRRLELREELSWILVLRSDSEVIGSSSLWPSDEGVELGFALGRAYWGLGLAVEASRAAIDWVRTELGPTWPCDDLLDSRQVLESASAPERRSPGANRAKAGGGP
jgi:RimJ/RimL family protein N-acetyltransferase